jgi:hypothetical protein
MITLAGFVVVPRNTDIVHHKREAAFVVRITVLDLFC